MTVLNEEHYIFNLLLYAKTIANKHRHGKSCEGGGERKRNPRPLEK